jgi:hypothetical protein
VNRAETAARQAARSMSSMRPYRTERRNAVGDVVEVSGQELEIIAIA